MAIRDAFAQTQWFGLLAAVLARSGVRHVIVSPGSRSTPLVCAIERQADLHVTVCIDERAAGFVALGLARATLEVCALVCTSGTAAAHYYPAVIEALHSGVPLLIVSADRPLELQSNGAAQTTDQTRLFGAHVRGFFELGSADARSTAFEGLARKVSQAVALARGLHPGPVHLNAPAFKPLEPVRAHSPEEEQLEQRITHLLAQPKHQFHAGLLGPSASTASWLAERWAAARRPVLFCGPAPSHTSVSALAAFAANSGWPVLAELTHPIRHAKTQSAFALIDAFELVVRGFPKDLEPDLVLSVGATPTSSAWLAWLAQCGAAALDVVAPFSLVDPLNRASTVIQCHEEPLFEAVNRCLSQSLAPDRSREWVDWGTKWRAANLQAQRRVELYLTQTNVAFAETHVLAELSKHVGSQDVVLFGNSLPIRVAETFFAANVSFKCESQRGVSGIDGLIAGAVGAHIGTRQRTWLVLGDVSAVHDLSSLRLLKELDAHVIVVIVDNDGGRIFDFLPVAKQVPDTTLWTTPHQTPFAAIATALGVPATTVSNHGELVQALSSVPKAGPCVVWARVAPNGAELAYRDLAQHQTQAPV